MRARQTKARKCSGLSESLLSSSRGVLEKKKSAISELQSIIYFILDAVIQLSSGRVGLSKTVVEYGTK